MAQDPFRYFRLEARELLDQLTKDVLELEKRGGEAAVLQRLLRHGHTLKGAARVVKHVEIADQAHAIEDTLSPFRDAAADLPRATIDAVLKRLDAIGEHVAALTPGAVAVAVAVTEAKPLADESIRTVRADITDMDALLHGVLETHSLLNGLRAMTQAMEREQNLADILVARLSPHRSTDLRSNLSSTSPTLSIAEDLRNGLVQLSRNFGRATDQLDRELRELRDAAEQLRLVPAGTLLTSLERTARDAAQALAKEVTFAGRGGDLRFDAHVLGTVQAALVQIVRNAVAHGIESPAERLALGKPAAGHVAIAVSRRANRIIFECQDDGRGMDVDAVRRVAMERGMLDANATNYSAEDMVRLLLRGGISTSATVTATSGRGVGLDVVRDVVEQLGGEVSVRTQPGLGTIFQLVVPPSLASTEVLKVEAAGTTYAIPLGSVKHSMHVAAADIALTPSGALVLWEDKAIPFVPLPQVVNASRELAGRGWTTVVLSGLEGFAAIGVDRLLGTSRIVIHPLPDHTPASRVVSGAALDAEGNPELVLDPDGLAAEAHQKGFVEIALTPVKRPILVIDDSLTTRMLEQSILESAGYEVDLALSGEEGLEKARRKRYALFLVDVEMPGIDGFTFVERARSDPALREIPAILVTSRAAPEDRQRGQEVGAQGYIVKGDFDQAKFLSMIRPLAR